MRSKTSQFSRVSKHALYDRMFRVKPYTKCIQCITQNRLRCENCMNLIIHQISQNNQSNLSHFQQKSISPNTYRRQSNKSIKTMRKFNNEQIAPKTKNKQNNSNICVISKYNFWMKEKKKKRQNKQFQSTFIKYWPTKTKIHEYSLQGVQSVQPRFERWERKLLDQLVSKAKNL